MTQSMICCIPCSVKLLDFARKVKDLDTVLYCNSLARLVVVHTDNPSRVVELGKQCEGFTWASVNNQVELRGLKIF